MTNVDAPAFYLSVHDQVAANQVVAERYLIQDQALEAVEVTTKSLDKMTAEQMVREADRLYQEGRPFFAMVVLLHRLQRKQENNTPPAWDEYIQVKKIIESIIAKEPDLFLLLRRIESFSDFQNHLEAYDESKVRAPSVTRQQQFYQ